MGSRRAPARAALRVAVATLFSSAGCDDVPSHAAAEATTSTTSAGSTQCASAGAGWTECAGTCIDVRNDSENCGTCGNVCGLGAFCWARGCRCHEGEALCDGRCLDIETDLTNCGGCGVSCRAAEPGHAAMCVGGSCTSAVILASGLAGPHAIAATETFLYFTETSAGRVSRVAKTGGPVEVIVTEVPGLSDIALDGERVYWTSASGVAAAPLDGGPSTVIASGESAYALALSDDRVAWAGWGWDVFAAPKVGGDPVPLFAFENVSSYPSTWGLGSFGGEFYCSVDSYDCGRPEQQCGPAGLLVHLGDTSDLSIVLVSGLARPTAVAATADFVYWLDDYGLQRVPSVGAKMTERIADVPGVALAVEDADVYWSTGAKILRVPKTGGSWTPIATARAADLVTDAGAVYWTDTLAGRILTIAK